MAKKYAALERFLRNCKQDIVTLSFAQIEIEIGCDLPKSAKRHPAWWGNNPTQHSQAQAWLNAGYRVRADQKAGIAYFKRDHI